jgi:hypothetical protein
MSNQGGAAAVGAAAVVIGGGIGVADVVGGSTWMTDIVGGSAGVADVVGGSAGVTDVVGGSGAGVTDAVGGSGAAVTDAVGGGLFGFLGEVATGIFIGVAIVLAVGFVLFSLFAVVAVGARRREQAQAVASRPPIPSIVPRTLRSVRCLLPSEEGAAWLAEVISCLAEAHDKGERRRHVRDYRRAVPQLLWTGWVLHSRGSRSRTLREHQGDQPGRVLAAPPVPRGAIGSRGD